MDVSVIVPVRDAEATLGRCLESLRALRHQQGALEVVLVDHGSTDRSVEIARGFPELRLEHQENRGPYAARNLGARVARGAVLLFTEAGCVVEPDWVERHLEALAATGASIVIGRVAPIASTPLLDAFLAYETVRDRWNFSSEYWKRLFGRPSNLAVRRARFASHGPFAEVLRGADSILVQRVARELSTAEVAYCERAVVRNLGLRGLPSCLRQRHRFSYLMSSLRSSHSAPLRFGDRLRVFRETVRGARYGPLRAAALAASLALGNLAFKSGRWRAALRPIRPEQV